MQAVWKAEGLKNVAQRGGGYGGFVWALGFPV
jgi:hypothetical protein